MLIWKLCTSGEGWITKEDFYNTYIEYCKAEGLPVKGKGTVGRQLPKFTHVESAKKRTPHGVVRAWKGVKFSNREC